MQSISEEEYSAVIKDLGETNVTSEEQLLIRYQIAQDKYQEEIKLLMEACINE